MNGEKAKPIIFSGTMVQAILVGTKSQTRRVIKPQPKWGNRPTMSDDGTWALALEVGWGGEFEYCEIGKCPYGQGGLLWVRETWAVHRDFDNVKPSDLPTNIPVTYRADGFSSTSFKWRPSIFMPRWASRILLRITDVKVERVQDISEGDAKNEGIKGLVVQSGVSFSDPRMLYVAFPDKEGGFFRARDAFEALWNSINERRGYGWTKNPWVWVVEFQLYKQV